MNLHSKGLRFSSGVTGFEGTRRGLTTPNMRSTLPRVKKTEETGAEDFTLLEKHTMLLFVDCLSTKLNMLKD